MVNEDFSEEERREIINYSMKRVKVRALFFLYVVLAGVILNVLFEGLLFWFSFCCIRKYAGGYHADTQVRCSLISGGIIIVVFMLLKFTPISMIVGILLQIGSYLVIVIFSPVENKNRKLNHNEKKRFRRKTRVISSALFIGTSFMYFYDSKHYIWSMVIAYLTVAILIIMGMCKNFIEDSDIKENGLINDRE